MPRNPDLSLVVQNALTDIEKREFLDRFCHLNPRWRGAHVADVLCVLFDHEEHLEVIEAVAEEAKDENPCLDPPQPGFEQDELFDLCVLAVIYAHGPECTKWAVVKPLLMKCKQEAAA
jgi:hypothetical protein